MDNSLNFTLNDSFESNLLEKLNKNKQIFAQLSEKLNDDNDDDNNDQDQNSNDDPHSSTMMVNDDNKNELINIRRSISRLLNVHVPLDLDLNDDDNDHNDDIEHNDDRQNRLRLRLNKISSIYSEDKLDLKKIENPNNECIMREKQNLINDESKPRFELRDRLKMIADSYYPICKDSNVKIASPKSQPLIVEQSKPIEKIDLNKSKSVAYQPAELKQIQTTVKPERFDNKSIVNVRTNSVANLKQIFEKKIHENSDGSLKESAPELLPVREKKRLFEKAIQQENEAKCKQYRKVVVEKPLNNLRLQRRQPFINEDPCQSPKRLKEIETESTKQEEIESKSNEMIEAVCQTFKCIDDIELDDDSDVSDPNDGDNVNSSIQENWTDIDDKINESPDLDDDAVSQHENPVPVIDDNCEVDDDEQETEKVIEEEDTNMMEITFTALDNDDNIDELSDSIINRSSTKVNLSNNSSETFTASTFSLPPEKPKRLYLYENDVILSDDNQLTNVECAENDPIKPPLRTISYYREEQRRLREEQYHKNQSEADEKSSAETFQSKIDDEREQFRLECQTKMIELKNEINGHHRVLNQALTALNLSLSMNELRNSDSRVEAERLLLISNEKIESCRLEIRRLQSMISNVDHYIQRNATGLNTNGILQIDHIKLPLLDDFVAERARGKLSSVFHFICLICHGPKVYASKLIDTNMNRSEAFIKFDLGLIINELSEDFLVTIKIYSLELSDHDNNHQSKYRFTNSPFKTIRKKLMHSSSAASSRAKPVIFEKNSLMAHDKLSSTEQSIEHKVGNFHKIGYVELTLQNVKTNKNKFYSLDANANYYQPVMDNYLTMNIRLRLSYCNRFLGYFDMKINDDSFWNVRCLRHHNEHIRYYRFGEEKNLDQPLGTINLKYCINPIVELLKCEHRFLCRRSNSLILVTIDPPPPSQATLKKITIKDVKRMNLKLYYISSQSASDCENFCSSLNKILHDIRQWEPDALQPFDSKEFDHLLSNLNQ